MDVLTTLKINDTNGNLLHRTDKLFGIDTPCTLDEFIDYYGEHIEEYLLNQIQFTCLDNGAAVLRFHYLELKDDDGASVKPKTARKSKFWDDVAELNATINARTIIHFVEINHQKRRSKQKQA